MPITSPAPDEDATPASDVDEPDAGGEDRAEEAEPVLFLDHNIGGHLMVQALLEAGAVCKLLREEFEPDASDEDWLVEVGRRGWFVLTKDKRIALRVNEIEALRNAHVGAFVLSSTDLNGAQMAAATVTALPKIRAFIRDHKRPFIAKFYKDGRVEAWK